MEYAIESSFEKAFREVFAELGLNSISIEKNDMDESQVDMLCSIGMTGALRGYLILRLDNESLDGFIRHLSGYLDMGNENDKETVYRKSVIGEIANQTAGRSAMILSKSGYDCLITPPTILTGKSLSASSTDLNDRAFFLIKGSFGKIGVFIGLQKKLK
jgi:CheY-specific phosphatase CheX